MTRKTVVQIMATTTTPLTATIMVKLVEKDWSLSCLPGPPADETVLF